MSDHDTSPQNKADLLARIQQGHAALDAFIAPLSAARMTTSGPDGAWSVKDHIAHLTACLRIATLHLRGHPEREHELLQIDASTYAALDLDGQNAAIYAANKDRALAEVRAAFEQAYQELLTALDGTGWADLRRPASDASPDAETLLDHVIGNTYAHFAEHIGWMRAQLAPQPPA